MKYTIDELRKNFEQKANHLEELMDLAMSKPVLSPERTEYANSIAVELRTLLCYSGGESLSHRCKYDVITYYPFISNAEAINLLPSYPLTAISIINKRATFKVDENPYSIDKVACTYLTQKAWLNETIIDLKIEGWEPLTREKLIKLIADKHGAHFDVKIDPYVQMLIEGTAFPMVISQGEEPVEARWDNLFTETIIGIAKEFTLANKHCRNKIKRIGISKSNLYIQNYSNGNYKYMVCEYDINAYNSNNFYECDVSKHIMHDYEWRYKGRRYLVGIIDV